MTFKENECVKEVWVLHFVYLHNCIDKKKKSGSLAVKHQFLLISENMLKNITTAHNSPPPTRDVTCSRHYLDRKKMRKCQMNNLHSKIRKQGKLLYRLDLFIMFLISLTSLAMTEERSKNRL